MRTKEFIARLLDFRNEIVIDDPHSTFRPEVAILTSFFKFPCNFKNNTCAGYPNLRANEENRCCCHNCGNSHGHFQRSWPASPKLLAYYARKFNPVTGFWRKNKGCILPRHKRSLVCANYRCYDMLEEFESMNSGEILNLHYLIGEYTACRGRYGTRDGQYRKDFIRSEKKLQFAVDKFMWDRELYYDSRTEELLPVTEKKIYDSGWVSLTLKGRSGTVGFNHGKKWIDRMNAKIEYPDRISKNGTKYYER